MGRKKVGGFVFEWYIGDHRPLHVHVFKDGLQLGRFNLESQRPMKDLKMTRQLQNALILAGFMKEKKS